MSYQRETGDVRNTARMEILKENLTHLRLEVQMTGALG